MPTDALLQVKDLSAGYAGSRVLFDVSMQIRKGQVMALYLRVVRFAKHFTIKKQG